MGFFSNVWHSLNPVETFKSPKKTLEATVDPIGAIVRAGRNQPNTLGTHLDPFGGLGGDSQRRPTDTSAQDAFNASFGQPIPGVTGAASDGAGIPGYAPGGAVGAPFQPNGQYGLLAQQLAARPMLGQAPITPNPPMSGAPNQIQPGLLSDATLTQINDPLNPQATQGLLAKRMLLGGK